MAFHSILFFNRTLRIQILTFLYDLLHNVINLNRVIPEMIQQG